MPWKNAPRRLPSPPVPPGGPRIPTSSSSNSRRAIATNRLPSRWSRRVSLELASSTSNSGSHRRPLLPGERCRRRPRPRLPVGEAVRHRPATAGTRWPGTSLCPSSVPRSAGRRPSRANGGSAAWVWGGPPAEAAAPPPGPLAPPALRTPRRAAAAAVRWGTITFVSSSRTRWRFRGLRLARTIGTAAAQAQAEGLRLVPPGCGEGSSSGRPRRGWRRRTRMLGGRRSRPGWRRTVVWLPGRGAGGLRIRKEDETFIGVGACAVQVRAIARAKGRLF